MKKRNIVLLLALAGAAYLALKKKQAETPMGTVSETPGVTPSATVTETPMAGPVVHTVEETLEQKAAHADAPA